MTLSRSYLMENLEEAIRLEIKTDPEAIRKQALWCGLKPGLRVLDVGCGPGKVTSILHEMIRPGGNILGVDYSEERIRHAKQRYGQKACIDFQVHDLRYPLKGIGLFDLIWVRFFLEYYRAESPEIVRNLTECLKPGGYLCLLDLDNNCLNHYELPAKMEKILFGLMDRLEKEYNFDPYSGRKLYAYLYDLDYQNIQLDLIAHHLFYAEMRDEDIFNWIKKVEVTSSKTKDLFEKYPGGRAAFFSDFTEFFLDPRRFTYTPLILCKGMKPETSQSSESR
ncbi:MAG: class I SAM-dependent methyltransferase [Deltaproteobacteria bacterium]|nr:class I SAM-dependent methyltransferase [Deltaproteobacteria bacterium]